MAVVAKAIENDPAVLIRRAYDGSPDVATATEKLEKWARKDKALYDYLTDPYLSQACYNAIRGLCRSERRLIYTAPNYTKGGNGHRVEIHGRSLLDFPLPGGKRLRDATRQDLLEAADFYRKQAADMASKAAWLEKISERVGKKTVGEKLTSEQLEALK